MNFSKNGGAGLKKTFRSAATTALALCALAPAHAQRLKIIGGRPVQPGDPIAGSTVLIVGIIPPAGGGDAKPQEYICTGSLIAPDTLVTAAHCVAEDVNAPVAPANLRLLFGLSVTPETKNLPPMRTASGYQYAPGWKGAVNGAESGDDTHDIAVIHFDGGLPAGYAPAALLDASVPLAAGTQVTLAGYGADDGVGQTGAGTLREVSGVPVLETLGQTEVVMDQSGGKGSCNGDSGGPAFLNVGGQNFLWGVTSRGDQTCSQVGIYTRITAYSDFVGQAEDSLRSQDESAAAANADQAAARLTRDAGLRQSQAAATALGVFANARLSAE